ncbi:MAG: OadG family protein [Caldisericia bacterium]|jgi:Na+-transporting methylmalonyl-CoA/oxaloacetate decarboxylase gamma subunit|nr:OadG family protein [Caldisericia bacterium]
MEVKTLWDTIVFGIFAMSIVMGVLAFLGFIIYLFKYIFYKESKISPPLEKKREEKIEIVKKEEKENKKVAAIIAAINMYLSSKRKVSFAFSPTLAGGEEKNIWRLKGIIGKRVNSIKERRWRNG